MMSVMFRFIGFDKVVYIRSGREYLCFGSYSSFFFSPDEGLDMVAFMDSAVVSFVSHSMILGYARYWGHTA